MPYIKKEPEEHPAYDEIQKRAYELYLARGRQDGQDIQDWLFAEEQLCRERSQRGGDKTGNFVVRPGGVAKTDSLEDVIIAEEEWRQVQASEELKEEPENFPVPQAKAVAAGQQRSK